MLPKRCAPCIRCACWRWRCPSLRPSTRWYCATSITATRSTSTPFWRLTCCIGCADNDVEWLQPFAGTVRRVGAARVAVSGACCFTTPARGWPGDNHVHGSLQLALAALDRLGLSEEEAQTVGFLIASHLEMSSTLRRRDIYDPETVRELAGKMETPERLKMLTLLTLADIKAVNPEALTPWKAENLWQLYIATANYFDRSVDEQRFHAEVAPNRWSASRRCCPRAARNC